MAIKEITFKYEGVDYTLGYSRNTIRTMERNGFSLDKLPDAPVTYFPMLFDGAFLLYHKKMEVKKIHEIYNHISCKDELLPKLLEMYNSSVSTLMEEPEEDDEKKVVWEANF